jgi:hypothetical protein
MEPTHEEIMALLFNGDVFTFDHIYKDAQALEHAEKSGDANKLKQLDFAVDPMVFIFFSLCAI